MSKIIRLKKTNKCSNEHFKKISQSQFKRREFHSHFHSYSTQIRSKNARQGAIFKQLFFATTYPPTRTSESKRAKTGHLFVKVTMLLPYLTQREYLIERGPEDISLLPPRFIVNSERLFFWLVHTGCFVSN